MMLKTFSLSKLRPNGHLVAYLSEIAYSTWNNEVPLTSGSGFIWGNWKWHYSIDRVRVPPIRLIL